MQREELHRSREAHACPAAKRRVTQVRHRRSRRRKSTTPEPCGARIVATSRIRALWEHPGTTLVTAGHLPLVAAALSSAVPIAWTAPTYAQSRSETTVFVPCGATGTKAVRADATGFRTGHATGVIAAKLEVRAAQAFIRIATRRLRRTTARMGGIGPYIARFPPRRATKIGGAISGEFQTPIPIRMCDYRTPFAIHYAAEQVTGPHLRWV